MNESIEAAKRIIDGCSKDEQRVIKEYVRALVPHPLETDWGIDADTILGAIRRSSDLTKRGVRGIIAEAVFESSIAPMLAGSDWRLVDAPNDLPYDALLDNGSIKVRIQIKLQRLEAKSPKLYYPKHYPLPSRFVVEVQKTRGGEGVVKSPIEAGSSVATSAAALTEQTRGYKFGAFDILAVNLHPSSYDWKNFRYTVASWLLPRPTDPSRIAILQPVDDGPSEVWTGNLLTCLKWFESGEQRSVLSELLHIKHKAEKPTNVPKKKKKPKSEKRRIDRKRPES